MHLSISFSISISKSYRYIVSLEFLHQYIIQHNDRYERCRHRWYSRSHVINKFYRNHLFGHIFDCKYIDILPKDGKICKEKSIGTHTHTEKACEGKREKERETESESEEEEEVAMTISYPRAHKQVHLNFKFIIIQITILVHFCRSFIDIFTLFLCVGIVTSILNNMCIK